MDTQKKIKLAKKYGFVFDQSKKLVMMAQIDQFLSSLSKDDKKKIDDQTRVLDRAAYAITGKKYYVKKCDLK